MKKVLYLLLILLTVSCTKENSTITYYGTVIGKFRSWGGGIGVSMNSNTYSNVSYKGYNHVVEALNIPIDLPENTVIKFTARKATESESIFPMSADGFEGSPIIYITDYSIQ
ncbi:MAG: hypothetical protein H6553_01285 [Chitinophagales bacterium]|nr:hypothetical protein [Chitinophagales bacterium]